MFVVFWRDNYLLICSIVMCGEVALWRDSFGDSSHALKSGMRLTFAVIWFLLDFCCIFDGHVRVIIHKLVSAFKFRLTHLYSVSCCWSLHTYSISGSILWPRFSSHEHWLKSPWGSVCMAKDVSQIINRTDIVFILHSALVCTGLNFPLGTTTIPSSSPPPSK